MRLYSFCSKPSTPSGTLRENLAGQFSCLSSGADARQGSSHHQLALSSYSCGKTLQLPVRTYGLGQALFDWPWLFNHVNSGACRDSQLLLRACTRTSIAPLLPSSYRVRNVSHSPEANADHIFHKSTTTQRPSRAPICFCATPDAEGIILSLSRPLPICHTHKASGGVFSRPPAV